MRLFLSKLGLLIGLALSSLPSFAAVDVYEFDNEVDRKRYQSFIDEMRCPKCQNQNLSGSDSQIAMDLRRELYLMIKDGKSDKEIVDFMVERYGDFILYHPPLKASTLVLWVAPWVLLGGGIILLIVIVRRRRALDTAAASHLTPEERQRLDALLQTTQAAKASDQQEKLQ